MKSCNRSLKSCRLILEAYWSAKRRLPISLIVDETYVVWFIALGETRVEKVGFHAAARQRDDTTTLDSTLRRTMIQVPR